MTSPVEGLQSIIEIASSIVLLHPREESPEPLCSALASSLNRRLTIVTLRSDHISEQEGADLAGVLTSGEVLLLIGSAAKTLPGELQRAWDRFTEHPEHTQAGAGRWIRFTPVDRGRPLGTLLLVLPEGYGGAYDRSSPRAWLRDLELDSGASSVSTVRQMGLAPATQPHGRQSLLDNAGPSTTGVPARDHRSWLHGGLGAAVLSAGD